MMIKGGETQLTPAQRGRLDGIARNDDQTKVIAWSLAHNGPVLINDGISVVITPRGRKVRFY